MRCVVCLIVLLLCSSACAGHPRTYYLVPGPGGFYAVDVTPRIVVNNSNINKPPYNPIFDGPNKYPFGPTQPTRTRSRSSRTTQTSQSYAGSSTTWSGSLYRSYYDMESGGKWQEGPQLIENSFCK